MAPVPASDLEVTAVSLRKGDLPNGFPFQVLHEDFAILGLTVTNHSSEPVMFDPESLQVLGPGGKKLKRALPTDVTPKLIKYYKSGQLGVHGEIFAGGRPTRRQWGRVPNVEPRPRAGGYSIEVPERIREILEYYEVQPGQIEPGQETTGFLYVKSKKVGSKLSGGKVQLDQKGVPIE